jgi:AP-3 complex subunit delta-1
MTELLFQKSLQDLVTGIRAHKNDPSAFIAQAMNEIKRETKSTDADVKSQAVRKLTYLQMIGYDVNWSCFFIIEVMSQPRFTHKRVGYLAAAQIFNETTEVSDQSYCPYFSY